MIGKEVRLRRLLNPHTKKMLIVPIDHGVTVDPISGIEKPEPIIKKNVNSEATGVILYKGLIGASCDSSRQNVGMIVHLSAGTILSPDINIKTLVCTVEEAIKLGADAVSLHVNIGANTETDMFKKIGDVTKSCMEWGMPLLAMMYARGSKIENEYDVKVVKHAARIGAELGAYIVKVNYTGNSESLSEVVNSCHVPVVIAGGKKVESDEDLLLMVKGLSMPMQQEFQSGEIYFKMRILQKF